MFTQNQARPGPRQVPGLAKRHEGYVAVMALAESATVIEDMTYRRAEYTLKRARSQLCISRAAHQVLLLLLDNLTAESWRKADYLVWPSNATLAEDSGDGERSVRGSLAELERMGLILRHYTRANRRMTIRGRADGGIDLAPLAARFAEIESAVIAREETRADRRALAWTRRQDIAREEVESFRLEQSPKTQPVDSVTDKHEPTARNAARTQHEGTTFNTETGTNKDCSGMPECPGEGGGKLSSPGLGETPRGEILRVWELSPQLCELLPLKEIQSAPAARIAELMRGAVGAILPLRNTDQTFEWLVQHHGLVTAATILVAALEDPTVGNPYGWLGGFVRADFARRRLDFSANLRRITAKRQFDRENPVEPPIPEQPEPWASVVARLAKRLKPEEIRAWISPLQFAGVAGDRLTLIARSPFTRDYLKSHFGDVLTSAVRAELGQEFICEITLSPTSSKASN